MRRAPRTNWIGDWVGPWAELDVLTKKKSFSLLRIELWSSNLYLVIIVTVLAHNQLLLWLSNPGCREEKSPYKIQEHHNIKEIMVRLRCLSKVISESHQITKKHQGILYFVVLLFFAISYYFKFCHFSYFTYNSWPLISRHSLILKCIKICFCNQLHFIVRAIFFIIPESVSCMFVCITWFLKMPQHFEGNVIFWSNKKPNKSILWYSFQIRIYSFLICLNLLFI